MLSLSDKLGGPRAEKKCKTETLWTLTNFWCSSSLAPPDLSLVRGILVRAYRGEVSRREDDVEDIDPGEAVLSVCIRRFLTGGVVVGFAVSRVSCWSGREDVEAVPGEAILSIRRAIGVSKWRARARVPTVVALDCSIVTSAWGSAAIVTTGYYGSMPTNLYRTEE